MSSQLPKKLGSCHIKISVNVMQPTPFSVLQKINKWQKFLVIIACVLSNYASANDNVSHTSLQIAQHHKLEVVEAIALFYLKQESILAARDLLKNIGLKYNFNSSWNPNNTEWKLAENELVKFIMKDYRSDFLDYKWLYPEWRNILDQKFTNQELIFISKHFLTPVGGKQVHIIDHQIAAHVQNSFSLAGKFQNVPGTEIELSTYQNRFSASRENAYFATNDMKNADGQAFALSDIGKRYFVVCVLQVVGIINRKLYQLAAKAPATALRYSGKVDVIIKSELQTK